MRRGSTRGTGMTRRWEPSGRSWRSGASAAGDTVTRGDGMDLNRALAVMRTETRIRGRSDHSLVLNLATKLGAAAPKPLLPAAGLHRGIRFRPCEVLHLLSYVTRPRYQADL